MKQNNKHLFSVSRPTDWVENTDDVSSMEPVSPSQQDRRGLSHYLLRHPTSTDLGKNSNDVSSMVLLSPEQGQHQQQKFLVHSMFSKKRRMNICISALVALTVIALSVLVTMVVFFVNNNNNPKSSLDKGVSIFQDDGLNATDEKALDRTFPPILKILSMNPSLSQTSSSPENIPSLSPTRGPSILPPIDISTTMPTYDFSLLPSLSSSITPTVYPSNDPTSFPSLVPSSIPLVMPSLVLSVHPLTNPSSHPSDMLSSKPSMAPSVRPTMGPISYPSGMPSSLPSSIPTDIPTKMSSLSLSVLPSLIPPKVPSLSPTQNELCYAQHTATSGIWWNATSLNSQKRHAWFLQRKPYQPILKSGTMIIGVLYSFTKRTIKLSAYFPPLYPDESRIATLVLNNDMSESATRTTKCSITSNIWHCAFRIQNVSRNIAYTYQVQYHPMTTNHTIMYTYDGHIPKSFGYPLVAVLGCFGLDSKKGKNELVEAVKSTSPDLLILSGDQTYHHNDLVHGFLETIYTIQELTRSRPTLVLMDDHDYGQANLNGAADGDEISGWGFEKPVCLINGIEELIMSHNPDPERSTILWNGLHSRYTSYKYGRVDFAITEARKFKNASSNVTRDSLLGHEQEEWLSRWCDVTDDFNFSNNKNKLKVVLAVTPFASLMTHKSSMLSNQSIVEVTIDSHDSNGYPVAGRNRAMRILKGCSPLVISGDQHAGIVVTYDEYGVTDCVSPAVLNSVFWRFNYHAPNASYLDVWGHQYTLHNTWSVNDNILEQYQMPRMTRNSDNDVKKGRADGFMTVDLDGSVATCTMHGYWLGHEIMWNVTVPHNVHVD